MTTIAYNHKEKSVAYDSQETFGNMIVNNNVDKKIVASEVIFFTAGLSADIDIMIANYLGETSEMFDCEALIIDNNKVFHFTCDGRRTYVDKVNENTCLGSGAVFALSAMDFGNSAKDAVKYAIKKDIYSGGKVRVFNI